jgi:hypothetical protein
MRKTKNVLESTMLPRQRLVLKLKMVKRQNTEGRIQNTGVRSQNRFGAFIGVGVGIGIGIEHLKTDTDADTDSDSDGFGFLICAVRGAYGC